MGQHSGRTKVSKGVGSYFSFYPHHPQVSPRSTIPRYPAHSFLTPLPPSPQVKTQRALNDYRKSDYPHYRDELTRLRYIGTITATRLKDVKHWVARDVPMHSVETVEELKRLMEVADGNRWGREIVGELHVQEGGCFDARGGGGEELLAVTSLVFWCTFCTPASLLSSLISSQDKI